jgi:hypothetical protein
VQTLPAKKRTTTRNRSESDATLYDPYEPELARLLPGSEEDLSQNSPNDSTSTSSILTHRVLLAIVNFGFLAFLEIALSALLPIFLASSAAVGGLGLSLPSIGTVLGSLGILNGLLQILFFVPTHELLGTRNLYTLGVAVFAGIYGLMPLISRWVKECSGSIGWQSWALLATIGLLCPIENMAFSTSLIPLAALDVITDEFVRLRFPLRQRFRQVLFYSWRYKRGCADCCVPRARSRTCGRRILIRILQSTPGNRPWGISILGVDRNYRHRCGDCKAAPREALGTWSRVGEKFKREGSLITFILKTSADSMDIQDRKGICIFEL